MFGDLLKKFEKPGTKDVKSSEVKTTPSPEPKPVSPAKDSKSPKKETFEEKFSKQRQEIESMTQKEAGEYAVKNFSHLVDTMYPDDFLFLLEKISPDTWKKIFGSLTEKDKFFINDKVELNPEWKKRLETLINSIKSKDKFTTQEIDPEYERVVEKAESLITEIRALGYSITPATLEEKVLPDVSGKTAEAKLAEIKETVFALAEIKKIIKEVKDSAAANRSKKVITRPMKAIKTK